MDVPIISPAVKDFAELRARMVREQLAARGIRDASVLEAMGRVERHRFVPAELASQAYDDNPLPIGEGQTISQPYIVAFMTEAVHPHPAMRALEIGTGSGYQAAILGELVSEVDTVEILPGAAGRAAALLAELGYGNVRVHVGDGFAGWMDRAPFDAILVAAAPSEIPPPLLAQLAPGGRLVIPIGDFSQDLVLVEKRDDGRIVREALLSVRFVPMTGEARRRG
ncbi:MAG: protein-L-isoaspartate(D-aspartate) O-methyltransferase [Acidobacteriota bacterium]